MGSEGSGQQSQFPLSGWQNSFYILTLEEVQSQLGDLGKPLGRMNLDELLNNVWSADIDQAVRLDVENDAGRMGQSSSASGLRRQGSIRLTQALSKKTVDEVWREIQQGKTKNSDKRTLQEHQPTLGEVTLEDFLVKAGVVAESLGKKALVEGEVHNLDGICNADSVVCLEPMSGQRNFQHQVQWMQYQRPQKDMMNAHMQGNTGLQPLDLSASPLLDVAQSENQMAMSSSLMGSLSDTQAPGRKRLASGDVVDRFIERRLKRMIKNRESAARSRARKQAYTDELENKISRLEEENERFRKEKELEKILHCAPFPEPKFQLRRTSSEPT